MGKPRCARIVAITIGSRTAAMIVKGSPHWGHCSISIANTRLSSRPNSSGRAPREEVPRHVVRSVGMALTGALRMMSGQLGVGRVHDEEVERPGWLLLPVGTAVCWGPYGP
jgi:hypothetical protein